MSATRPAPEAAQPSPQIRDYGDDVRALYAVNTARGEYQVLSGRLAANASDLLDQVRYRLGSRQYQRESLRELGALLWALDHQLELEAMTHG